MPSCASLVDLLPKGMCREFDADAARCVQHRVGRTPCGWQHESGSCRRSQDECDYAHNCGSDDSGVAPAPTGASSSSSCPALKSLVDVVKNKITRNSTCAQFSGPMRIGECAKHRAGAARCFVESVTASKCSRVTRRTELFYCTERNPAERDRLAGIAKRCAEEKKQGRSVESHALLEELAEKTTTLLSEPPTPGLLKSASLCDGDCCAPLHRNRTCAYTNLWFVPPFPRSATSHKVSTQASITAMSTRAPPTAGHGTSTVSPFFNYLASTEDSVDSSALTVGLSFRFHPGRYQERSLFTPRMQLPSAAAGVRRVIHTPIFIGADLHRNPGHNHFDYMYPAVLSLLRLRHVAETLSRDRQSRDRQSRRAGGGERLHTHEGKRSAKRTSAAAASLLSALPRVDGVGGGAAGGGDGAPAGGGDDFIYLVYESSERAQSIARRVASPRGARLLGGGAPLLADVDAVRFVEKVGGRVMFLSELELLCPRPHGCLVRTAFGGVGHTGLSMVDDTNVVGGARVHRSLWRFRSRVLARHRVLVWPTALPGAEPGAHAVGASGGGFGGGGGAINARSPLVLLVVNKRRFNLHEIRSAVWNATPTSPGLYPTPTVSVVRWEDVSFVAQLQMLQKASVHVSSVGTGSMNALYLPAGAVCVCLGWRLDSNGETNTQSKRRIMCAMAGFDPHPPILSTYSRDDALSSKHASSSSHSPNTRS